MPFFSKPRNASLLLLFSTFFLSHHLSNAAPAPAPATPPSSTSGNSIIRQEGTYAPVQNLSSTLAVAESIDIDFIFKQPNSPINAVFMLMNAVDALANLALEDYAGRSPPLQFTAPDYPGVVINMMPRGRETTVRHEVAVQCLGRGIIELVRTQRFLEVTLGCEWDDEEVLAIEIFKAASASAKKADANDIPTNNNDNNNNNATTTLDNLNAIIDPNFAYLPDGSNLGLTLIFVTIIDALAKFARHKSDESLGRSYTDPGPQWDASLLITGDGPIRSRPPYMEYRWMILSLRRAPRFMVQRRRFAELVVGVEVDGVVLGTALLQKGKPWD
ncbi:MAG: hypothetical protein Q9168_004023 [Polycauliona sp. 1 TL-2023]